MWHSKMLSGVLLAAAFVGGAVITDGAVAHEFRFSRGFGLISVKGDGGQIFTTPEGAIACTTVEGDGSFQSSNFLLMPIVSFLYSSCVTSFGTVKTPFTAKYLFSADNGEVEIASPIGIVVTTAGEACNVTIAVQKTLKAIAYVNVHPTVLLLANLEKVESSALGGGCPIQYHSNKTGKFTGNMTVQAILGEVEWK